MAETVELSIIDNMKEVAITPHLNLDELEEGRCFVPKDRQHHYILVECHPKKAATVCPACQGHSITRYGKGERPRLVHDISIGMDRIDLLLSSQRYKCADCGKVFRHQYESIIENRQCTARLYQQLCAEASEHSFTDVADRFGYTKVQISRIFDEYAESLEAQRGQLKAPRILGIDEKHIVHAMRAVFVDIETGRLLEMTPANKECDIVDTITSMEGYENFEVVTMDMANGYRSYIEYCLPNAKIVVDHYHVIQDLYIKVAITKTNLTALVNDRIKKEDDPDVRKKLVDALKQLNHNPYLFKFNRNRAYSRATRVRAMAALCDAVPEFNMLRRIKEDFEYIYDAPDREEAERRYQQWLTIVPQRGKRKGEEWERRTGCSVSRFEPLIQFCGATKRWHDEIMNYFDYRFTNAASEGVNALIQRINAEGAGYGFRHLRAKALYWSNMKNPKTYMLVNRTAPTPGNSPHATHFIDPLNPATIPNPLYYNPQTDHTMYISETDGWGYDEDNFHVVIAKDETDRTPYTLFDLVKQEYVKECCEYNETHRVRFDPVEDGTKWISIFLDKQNHIPAAASMTVEEFSDYCNKYRKI